MTASRSMPMPAAKPNGVMLAFVVLLLLAAGIQGAFLALRVGKPPTEMELLRLMPEADLLYPSSEVIADGGADAEWTITGHYNAFTWQYVGVDASPEEIERWYSAEMAGRGWLEQGGSSAIGAVEELTVRAWKKDGVILRLGIQDPGYWGANPEYFDRFESIYDVRLRGDD